MMHKFANVLITGMVGLALTCGFAQAQTSQGNSSPSKRRGSANRSVRMVGQNQTVTGCLQKEEKEKSEYLINGEDGKTWGLKSSSVKLADHLNHKVTVTGKV